MLEKPPRHTWSWLAAALLAVGNATAADNWVDLEFVESSKHHDVFRLKGVTANIFDVRHAAGHYWALAEHGTLYRSADFRRWERLSSGGDGSLLQLFESPDGNLFMQSLGGSADAFFSRDGGTTWHSAHQAQVNAHANDAGLAPPNWLQAIERVWMDQGRFRIGTFAPRGIMESADGTNWRSIAVETPATPPFSNRFRKRIGDVDYLVLLNNSIFSSQDGASWVREPFEGFHSNGIWIEEFRGRHVFAISWHGAEPRTELRVKTAQSGWTLVDAFGEEGMHALLENNGSLWALTSNAGRERMTVWQSSDATTWVRHVENLPQISLRMGPSPIGTLTGQSGGRIHRFTNVDVADVPVVADRFAELNRAPDAPPARPLNDPPTALENGLRLIEAAESGDAASRESLAGALLEGRGFYRNPAQAEFLISHWELPEERFAYSLGVMAEQADPPDPEKARGLFRRAAINGNHDAALRLAVYLVNGWGGDVNLNVARIFLNQVARHGTPTQKDVANARLNFVENLTKADEGDAEAAHSVGLAYALEKHDMVEQDWDTARRYLRKALEGGVVEAGRTILLRPETPEEGRNVRLRMAELGDEDSMQSVAAGLLSGQFGYPKDPVLAGKYYLKLAEGDSLRAKLIVARVMLGFSENEMQLPINRDLGRAYLEAAAEENFSDASLLLAYFNAREARGAKLPVDGRANGLAAPVFDLVKSWHDGKKAELAEEDIAALFRAMWRDADYSPEEADLAAEIRHSQGKALVIGSADGREVRFGKAPVIPASLREMYDRLFPDDWQPGEIPHGDYWMQVTGSPGFIVWSARLHPNLARHYQHTLAQMAMIEARKPGWDPLKAHLDMWRKRISHLDEKEAEEMHAIIAHGLGNVRNAAARGGKADMANFPEW